MTQKTHFGFKTIDRAKKQTFVRDVFDSVATKYDLMNDVLSFGTHRLWKDYAVMYSGLSTGDKVLDLAGGTGDMAIRLMQRVGGSGKVVLADINAKMLEQGRKRMRNQGFVNIDFVQLNAEALAFADNTFSCVCIAFGLRNMTNKQQALNESYRVLKTGGRLLVLEFSKVEQALLGEIYDTYSFRIMPKLGALLADDEDSYQYLAESIRRHPDQQTLKQMFIDAGFSLCTYYNLLSGIVALHQGVKQ